MKISRSILSAFVVFAIVGSALAFNSRPVNNGNLFCTDQGTTCTGRVDFIEQSGGTALPCGGTTQNPTPVYKAIIDDCVVANGPFVSVLPGN